MSNSDDFHLESPVDGRPASETRIRLLHDPSDRGIPACAALMAGTPLWQRYGVTQASAETRFRTSVQKNVAIFVAEKQAGDQRVDILGFVWAVPLGMFNRSGYIPILGTADSAFGTGLGGALLRTAERFLFETAPDIFLLCSDFNTRARKFYERHGYHQAGLLPGYLLPDVDEILYWKRLEG